VVADSGRAKKSVLTPIFQLAVGLGFGGRDPTETLEDARRIIIKWVQGKCEEKLPDDAFVGGPFDLSIPGHKFQAAQGDGETCWAAHIEHPDPEVAARHWLVDASLYQDSGCPSLGTRVLCASSPLNFVPLERSTPRFVRDIAQHVGLSDVREIVGVPWEVSSAEEIQKLCDLLSSPVRRLPVILISQRQGPRDQGFVVDPDDLALRCLGLAHVVTLDHDHAYTLAYETGREWAAYGGAVRTYKPGLRFERDDPHRHPLALPGRILEFAWRGSAGSKAFSNFLVDQTYLMQFPSMAAPFPLYTDVRGANLESERLQLQSISAIRQSYDQQIALLKDERQQWEALSESYSADAQSLQDDLSAQKSRVFFLEQQVTQLVSVLRERPDRSSSEALAKAVPESLDELEEWVNATLTGRVQMLPRAINSAKKGAYEDISRIYRCLLMLGYEYREFRLAPLNEPAQGALEKKRAELGVAITQATSSDRAGEFGDEYYVEYPRGSNKRRLLEWHVTKGVSREPRFCLRIYFFWDEETRAVVVGHLPSHLETKAS
jgi:hypothetical protein